MQEALASLNVLLGCVVARAAIYPVNQIAQGTETALNAAAMMSVATSRKVIARTDSLSPRSWFIGEYE